MLPDRDVGPMQQIQLNLILSYLTDQSWVAEVEDLWPMLGLTSRECLCRIAIKFIDARFEPAQMILNQHISFTNLLRHFLNWVRNEASRATFENLWLISIILNSHDQFVQKLSILTLKEFKHIVFIYLET